MKKIITIIAALIIGFNLFGQNPERLYKDVVIWGNLKVWNSPIYGTTDSSYIQFCVFDSIKVGPEVFQYSDLIKLGLLPNWLPNYLASPIYDPDSLRLTWAQIYTTNVDTIFPDWVPDYLSAAIFDPDSGKMTWAQMDTSSIDSLWPIWFPNYLAVPIYDPDSLRLTWAQIDTNNIDSSIYADTAGYCLNCTSGQSAGTTGNIQISDGSGGFQTVSDVTTGQEFSFDGDAYHFGDYNGNGYNYFYIARDGTFEINISGLTGSDDNTYITGTSGSDIVLHSQAGSNYAEVSLNGLDGEIGLFTDKANINIANNISSDVAISSDSMYGNSDKNELIIGNETAIKFVNQEPGQVDIFYGPTGGGDCVHYFTGGSVNVASNLSMYGSNYTTGTIADGDATPDMNSRQIYYYDGTTTSVTLTDFDNPVIGRIYTIIGTSDTYTLMINDGGNFNTSGTIILGLDDIVQIFVKADNTYIQYSPVQDN